MTEREELNRRASILETERRLEMADRNITLPHIMDLAKRLKKAEEPLNELLKACRALIREIDMLEQGEIISACQCGIAGSCAYCCAKATIAKAEKKEDSTNG